MGIGAELANFYGVVARQRSGKHRFREAMTGLTNFYQYCKAVGP